MAPPPRLAMAGIEKSFGRTAVLQEVALDLAPGEVLALLGANGAGKSTLIKILCGVYRKDRGTIHLNGEPVSFSDPPAARRHGVRLMPQEIAVLPDLSVAENILIGDLRGKLRSGRFLHYPVTPPHSQQAPHKKQRTINAFFVSLLHAVGTEVDWFNHLEFQKEQEPGGPLPELFS